MTFPTATIKSYFQTGDRPNQAQFNEFIDGVAAIDANSPKNNFTATTNPTVNDDVNAGYSVGSRWVNTSTNTTLTCVSAIVGGAIWNTGSGVSDGNKGDITVSGGGAVYEINAGAVSTNEIADTAVTTVKLASNSVTDAKLSHTGVANGTYTNATITVNNQGRITSASSGSSIQRAHFQDQRASGTAGGTFTSGAWQTRTINTAVVNEITGSSLGSNQITLPAGTYKFSVSTSCTFCGLAQLALFNVSDSSYVLYGAIGGSSIAGSTSNSAGGCAMYGIVTIASSKIFEIRNRCQTTRATDGLGAPTSFGATEVYLDMLIEKVA